MKLLIIYVKIFNFDLNNDIFYIINKQINIISQKWLNII